MSNNNQNNSSSLLNHILSKLKKVKYIGSRRYMAECPGHQDKEPSLSITTGNDGCILLKCHAGCATEDVVKALGLQMKDLFQAEKRGRGVSIPRKSRATLQRSSQEPENKEEKDYCSQVKQESVACNTPEGCTLEQYGALKRLPILFLRELGLSEFKYIGNETVRIPYYNDKQQEVSVQYRIALEGNNKFRWRKGDKPFLYGLNRDFKSKGYVVIVEGPSDAHTLWYNGFSALGVPGAPTWNEQRDASLLDGINSIFVVIEPDQGGIAVQKWLATSRIRERVKLLHFDDGYKDPSELFIHDPDNFKAHLTQAMAKAVSLAEVMDQQAATEKARLWAICRTLAEDKDILSKFSQCIERLGVAGESKNAKLLYLMLTSRHQKKPASGILKGPSAGGKSFIVDQVLRLFPASAYYALTSMSEHALAYSEEPLVGRFLILYEAAGISTDFANYLLRSLLSEGHIRYETVEKTSEGMKPKLIDREGPTGTIITTTQISLHPENETRLLSIAVSDTTEQTKEVLLALAEEKKEVDLTKWQALQRWIDFSEHRVVIPFAQTLAKLIPPVAVRLRRDFTQILNLIRSHAILQQATRKRDGEGRIIATFEDYAAVRELVADVISDGIGATVSQTIRETVGGIAEIIKNGKPHATVQQLAEVLKIDKSAASRRYGVAKNRGYLVNNENKRGKPAQIVLGDLLPEDVMILPDPEKLECCSVDEKTEGIDSPSPPPPLTKNGLFEVMDDGQLIY